MNELAVTVVEIPSSFPSRAVRALLKSSEIPCLWEASFVSSKLEKDARVRASSVSVFCAALALALLIVLRGEKKLE